MPQLSQSGRIVTLVTVVQGNVYYALPGATVWTPAVNNTGATPPLNFTGLVQSSPNIQKLWFADGVNYCYFDALAGTVAPWVASAGTLPADADNNFPRLITTWRGRTVLSGLVKDSQNWFMSAVNDPTNFDYAPLNVTPTQAIAGNNAPQGLIGDVITSLYSYSDDVLLFFGDHTLYMMAGDPMAGGQIDLVSDTVGGTWGRCACRTPDGTVFFTSNRMGVYAFTPGSKPVRVSQPIERFLSDVDTGQNTVFLQYEDAAQCIHIYVTPSSGPGPATHLVFELRPGAWWTETLPSTMNPLCGCTLDGNLPGDRVNLIGSWDGYVRFRDITATTDDGTQIQSYVLIGPVTSKTLDDILMTDLQAVMGDLAGDVSYQVFVGPTCESAINSTAVESGTWTAGRNRNTGVRRAGHAFYVKILSANPWQLEIIRATLESQGGPTGPRAKGRF